MAIFLPEAGTTGDCFACIFFSQVPETAWDVLGLRRGVEGPWFLRKPWELGGLKVETKKEGFPFENPSFP
jgi:hypothetical protein